MGESAALPAPTCRWSNAGSRLRRKNYVNFDCVAAYMSMHITKSASNLYMENTWFWIADHDIEDHNNTQISVFAGRGLLCESTLGRIWLVGTGVEHHAKYQYQFAGTQDIWMGQIQTETPYYQPNPPAPLPFVTVNTALQDPDFSVDCSNTANPPGSLPGNPPCQMAWGLRIIDSKNVSVFGAGLYSFFNNYNTSCSDPGAGEHCQARISYIGPATSSSTAAGGWNSSAASGGNASRIANVEIYNLNTIGSTGMINRNGPGRGAVQRQRLGLRRDGGAVQVLAEPRLARPRGDVRRWLRQFHLGERTERRWRPRVRPRPQLRFCARARVGFAAGLQSRLPLRRGLAAALRALHDGVECQ